MAVFLSLGYDVERPYGAIARTSEGKEIQRKQVAFMGRLLSLLDCYKIPRTLFILGDYLQALLDNGYDKGRFQQEIINPESSLNEIQQHTYSHVLIRFLGKWVKKKPLDLPQFRLDILRASAIIESFFGIRPTGIRFPYGYGQDLSDMPLFISLLVNLDFIYSSSLSRRTSDGVIISELDKQPYMYRNFKRPLVEMPSHGWQDDIFTGEKSQKYLGRKLEQTPAEYYSQLINDACVRSTAIQQDMYICLCLHLWAVMQYDPERKVHKAIINTANILGIKFVTHMQIAEELLNNNL
ncbi:MAG: polysaccharide deacetylase family protein [bacterium]